MPTNNPFLKSWSTPFEVPPFAEIDMKHFVPAFTAGMDEADWSIIGEAPPGHVPLRAVALHALWDSWIHERDILLPLGIGAVEEADEIASCLGYVAALSPAFAISQGSTRLGSIVVETTSCAPQ